MIKRFTLAFSLLLGCASATAEDIRCLVTPSENTKIEGMQQYTMFQVDLDVESPTQVTQVRMDSLFENGFYGNFPLNLVRGEFIEGDFLSFTYISAADDVTEISLYASYDATKRNYKSEVFNGREIEIRCMKLVGL